MKKSKKFKVGDKAWYIPGFEHPYLIVVEVELLEEMYPQIFWLDEPIGHAVLGPGELYTNLNEAKIELEKRKKEAASGTSSLDRFRKGNAKFILSTKKWKGGKPIGKNDRETLKRFLSEYKKDKAWFS